MQDVEAFIFAPETMQSDFPMGIPPAAEGAKLIL
jgi:hypothetical protein